MRKILITLIMLSTLTLAQEQTDIAFNLEIFINNWGTSNPGVLLSIVGSLMGFLFFKITGNIKVFFTLSGISIGIGLIIGFLLATWISIDLKIYLVIISIMLVLYNKYIKQLFKTKINKNQKLI